MFLESQFGYRPLIWMLGGRSLNNRINHLHERSLYRTVLNDYESSFQKLLELGNLVSIDRRNISDIESIKARNGVSNQIMSELLTCET